VHELENVWDEAVVVESRGAGIRSETSVRIAGLWADATHSTAAFDGSGGGGDGSKIK
jgi:hypothetical protein